ncbi:PAS domain S-box protein [Scytonema sp. PCC 10023]|uniref:hybrid sensor histidine kinase/response regulator n=1 Tax=Scytonema sp. PCC 10023 TaxID=1680591 RepID=UPI0039C6319D
MKGIRPLLVPYAVAALAVGGAFILTLLLQSLLMPTLCQLFFAAVAVSTWYGGMQPGLLATALCTLAMGYFFTEPVYLLGNFALDNILQLGTFVPVAILISSLTGLRTLKQHFDKIDAYHEIDQPHFSLDPSNLSPNLSPARREAFTLAPTLVPKGAGGLGFALVFPHDVKSQIEQHSNYKYFVKYPRTWLRYVRGFASHLPMPPCTSTNWSYSASLTFLPLSPLWENPRSHPASQGSLIFVSAAWFSRTVVGKPTNVTRILPDILPSLSSPGVGTEPGDFPRGLLNNLVPSVENGVLVREWGTQHDTTERQISQDTTRESDKLFRRLVESNIFGVALGDFSGGVHYANDYFLNMVGYTREELAKGKLHWDAITAPEYRHLDAQRAEELSKQGVGTPFEKEYIHKDGSRVPILIGGALLQEPYDCQQEMIVFSLDLRERKRIEEALHQREEQLRLITDAVPVLISYVDAEQCYRFNNKRYEEWHRIPASEIYGKHIKEVVGESGYESIRPYVEAVLTGEQVSYETHLLYQDGVTRYVNVSYVPQFSQGEVVGFVALISDISERKLSEAALKHSEERFRKLAEKVRVIPWEADATTGNFTYVGPQTVEILGYPLSDWYTDNFWADHIHPEDREWAIKHCIECSLSLENYEFEYRMLAADGRVVWLYDIVNVVRGEDGPQILRGFMIDISDRKQAEQEREQLLAREQASRESAQAANRMKDEFLATLSHELRTPLNAMLGWTQLLRSRKFDEETTARALETIDRNTKSLTTLIEDVLDVSRIITGKLRLDVLPVKITSVIKVAIDTVIPAADAKEICIEYFSDPSVGVILGDANRLQQIVWNLLSNAVKFTPKGGTVDVRLEIMNSRVQFQVRDTGEGIAPEFLPYVFERFRQADSSSTRSHGGLGLGLAIVRHLVELHGGTVRAESPGIGHGATFIVNLPMKVGATKTSEREQLLSTLGDQEVQDGLPNLGGLRVLVVDDEPDARQLLSTVLLQHKAQVIAVSSAREALVTLQKFQPDVLVSDIGMPQEDGYSLIRKIRALPGESGRTPAVALTAYARAEDRTQALNAGFQLHVAKPVNPTELATVVANLAGRT